jgi:cysteine-rich repeat protein
MSRVSRFLIGSVIFISACGSDERAADTGPDALVIADTGGSGDVLSPVDTIGGEDAPQDIRNPDVGGDTTPDSDAVDDGTSTDVEITESCDDGILNGDETDLDCGGSCAPCALRSSCESGADCESSLCDAGTCVDERCLDGGVSEGETDVDCGGEFCAPCATGDACLVGEDCREGVCTDDECAVPACDDGVRNGRETDVDCGTFCDPCGAGRSCASDDDCLDGACTDDVCAEPTCDDDRTNGDESGVDCGGEDCDPCEAGEPCVNGEDCDSGVCSDDLCAEPTCADLVANGNETGLDCGGPDCGGCPVGEDCSGGGDCESGVCQSGSCVGPGCIDDIQNGSETGVDCGGVDCASCSLGEGCSLGADCDTFVCVDNECAAAFCGDGLLGVGEDCDDGAFNNDTLADSCRTNCEEASCGDEVVDSGETCDDGAANGNAPDACRLGCVAPSCGDGVVDTGEECDTGAARSNTTPGACRLNCQAASCGDGVRDAGETCDNGAMNSNSTPGACRLDCRPARCGDGVVDSGEECDNGSSNGAGSCDGFCVRVASPCDDSTADYCVVLPYGSDTDLNVLFEELQRPVLDVGFVVDETGSMTNVLAALRTLLIGDGLDLLATGRPGTRFALAQFSGFSCGADRTIADAPFRMVQRMTSSNATLRSVAGSLEANGAGTEHIAEAMFQYATGLGRNNSSGCYTGAGTTASTPVVPSFNNEVGFSAGIADGTVGGAGFRANALRPMFLFTDEEGEARDDAFDLGATLQESSDALADAAVNVIGIWSTTGEPGASMIEWARTSAVPACAWNTSRPALCSTGQCCTGVGGAGVAPVGGVCPLAYRVSTSSGSLESEIRTSVTDGMRRWLSFGGVSTRLRIVGGAGWNSCLLQDVVATGTSSPNSCSPRPLVADLSGTGATDGYLRVPFGTDLPFDVSLANQCLRPSAETRLTAAIELRAGNVVLDTRTLEVIIPPRSACVGASCTIRCGNGAVEPGEACDDGNSVNSDACTNGCTLPTCGDGTVNVSVASRTFVRPRISSGGTGRFICDEGATCPSGSCSVSARPDAPEHGICRTLGYERATSVVWGAPFATAQVGTLSAGSWACSDFTCTRAGAASSTFPYTCEPWELLSQITCQGPGREDCDGGPGCSLQCQLPECGNGEVEFGEDCDDGNLSNFDTCTVDCVAPECGDGTINGTEECDDGPLNANAPAACRLNCTDPRCGDGILDPTEVCDDGNSVNTDACNNSCRPAACGDGVVQPPETCDDGNAVQADTCPNTCRTPICGDGVVQTSRGETCDSLNNPRCSGTTCTVASPAITCGHIDLGSAEGSGVAVGSTATAPTNFLPPESCISAGVPNAGGRDVAFYWIAPRAGTFTFSSEGSTHDTVMMATRLGAGAACPSVPTVCNDDFDQPGGFSDLQGRVSLSVTAGERILIVVDSYGTNIGTYRLSIN